MKGIIRFSKSIKHNRYTIIGMVKRDLKTKYAGSYLGLLWSIIHPISQILIFSFIFSVVMRIKLGPEFTGVNFTVWLVCGLIPWLYFVEVVSRAPNTIMDNVNLVTKMRFNSELLSFNYLISGLINHFISFCLLLIFLLANGIDLKATVFVLPLYLVGISLFMLGLSWLLASLTVYLRDIGQFIGVVLNLWFYFTPIVFPFSAIPNEYKVYLEINPVFYLIEGYRMILLSDEPINFYGLMYLFAAGMAMFLIGGLIFRKLKSGFADVL
ncbi:ABC transporter permease [Paenibacillus sp. sptzw28]|uniref:ABC transporter permease n=1 Tax=Paenibacillus sp. sptzw28 TaxID=715179 RepID=UPI001C6F122D|nr:ABC transporter permease [Paenibacillus sp. sptzw28]QYR21218.1 ABC transporter permease [Paenibacillus sp. sptzw28]